MATNNRGGNRGGNRSRGGRNNNPEGRNQYSSSVMSTARDNPIAAAAAVGGAVAAGVFLWSRRNQISDQISNLADQISEWREGTGSDSDFSAEDTSRASRSSRAPAPARAAAAAARARRQISEEALTLEGNRQDDRLGRSPRIQSGASSGRPFFIAPGNSAIASPNSGLVTELMCVPGTSRNIRVGQRRRPAPPPSRCPRPRSRTPPASAW